MRQTLPPDEVLILDDASTDDSLETINELRSVYPNIRLITNGTNSGNTFRQWNKGLSEVRGDYVWIAESDDYADSQFLEILVGLLEEHPHASIAFCRSLVVDASDREIGKFAHGIVWNWEQSCYKPGSEAIRGPFVSQCIIPNASSAVLRRSACLQVGPVNTDYALSGDWAYYLRLLQVGDLIYDSRPLNYFRDHAGSVRVRSARSHLVAVEAFRILDWLCLHDKPQKVELDRAYSIMANVWYRDWLTSQPEFLPCLLKAAWQACARDRLLPLRLLRLSAGSAFRAAKRAISPLVSPAYSK